jgi:uncharacterized membrane protein
MAVLSPAGRQTVISVAVISLLIGSALAPVTADTAVAQQTQPDADNTVTRIEVFENGSARWTIQIRTRLDTGQRVNEYTAFQSRFRNDTAQYLGPFRSRMRGVVANAENATGRQMRATNFTVSTSIQEVPRRWGVVTYAFTWTNFATQENGQVIVGDIFQGGFFLAANDTIQIVGPDGSEVSRVDPTPDSREVDMVTWNGREDFADAHPRVVFTPLSEQATGNGTATRSDAPPNGEGTPLQNIGGIAVAGIVVVVLLGLGGAVLYGRRNNDTDEPDGPAERTGGQAGAAPTAGRDVGPAGRETQAAVLTDEERVLELLNANGGRMRQAAIAEEFDWSASKTSRVVGRLSDEGSVEKLQLGRENLVTLPDDSA